MNKLPIEIEELIYSYIPSCKYCTRRVDLVKLYGYNEKYICHRCINRQIWLRFFKFWK